MGSDRGAEPGTPLSPFSPSTLSGLTAGYQHDEGLGIELDPRENEAQERKPERESVLSRLRRLSAGLSIDIPPHWKAGNINKQRIKRSVEDYTDGFPRFAAWMNCDVNFLLARRYGWLHNRVLMFRQSELNELEEELDELDLGLKDSVDSDALVDHQSFAEGDAGVIRKRLIQRIDEKLVEYS